MLVGRTNACVAPMKTEPKGSKWLQIPSLFCIPAPWTIQLQLVSGCKWYLADIAPNWDIVHQLHTTTNHLRIWQHDATWFCLTTGLILDHNFPLSTSSHFRQRFRVYVSFSNTPFHPKKKSTKFWSFWGTLLDPKIPGAWMGTPWEWLFLRKRPEEVATEMAPLLLRVAWQRGALHPKSTRIHVWSHTHAHQSRHNAAWKT